MDIAGHQVLRKDINLNELISIELQVSSGVYLARFSNAEYSVVKKIIVQ
jgi:hypothetical protein